MGGNDGGERSQCYTRKIRTGVFWTKVYHLESALWASDEPSHECVSENKMDINRPKRKSPYILSGEKMHAW